MPLDIVFTFGVWTSLVSFLLIGLFSIQRIFDVTVLWVRPSDVPGFTATILAILLFGGLQLVKIGLIGKYVGAIFHEVKQRPTFIVDKIINGNSTDTSHRGD